VQVQVQVLVHVGENRLIEGAALPEYEARIKSTRGLKMLLGWGTEGGYACGKCF
jgi:hypothetical protein